MRDIRRKEKAITNPEELKTIIQQTTHITLALCADNIPYLVTVTHGHDLEHNVLYFHCAHEGKKIEILQKNNLVWGQAFIDHGYSHGTCEQHYATTQFKGTVTFVKSLAEKKHALETIIRQQEPSPDTVIEKKVTQKAVERVNITRIDITYLSGKKSLKK
ncbi:MAG: pyridoxamine 5'-phosphate oxidase family protein [Candidatus Thermoplasmatota archaeon]|nr:pyridoxamine 5'-phosphate oxidase family protein [Candidatus Thermoplasmatota archaeon]